MTEHSDEYECHLILVCHYLNFRVMRKRGRGKGSPGMGRSVSNDACQAATAREGRQTARPFDKVTRCYWLA